MAELHLVIVLVTGCAVEETGHDVGHDFFVGLAVGCIDEAEEVHQKMLDDAYTYTVVMLQLGAHLRDAHQICALPCCSFASGPARCPFSRSGSGGGCRQ